MTTTQNKFGEYQIRCVQCGILAIPTERTKLGATVQLRGLGWAINDKMEGKCADCVRQYGKPIRYTSGNKKNVKRSYGHRRFHKR